MTLTELITSFKSRTGRLDLSDAEITVVLNQACRILDEVEDSDLRSYRGFFEILEGGYIAKMPDEFRFETSVTLHQATGSVVLKRRKSQDVRAALRDESIAIDSTWVYSTIATGFTQDFAADELPEFMDTIGLQTQPTDRNTYVVMYPKVAAYSTLEVEMIAYSTLLSGTVATNYWTLKSPELVIQAAQYHLTKDLLSIEESTKILQDLKLSVQPISFDLYAGEHISVMEG